MTSEQNRMHNLAIALTTATEMADIYWQQTDMPSTFLTSSKVGSITIAHEHQLRQSRYTFTLLDPQGNEQTNLEASEDSGQLATDLQALFESARSDALDIQSTISEWFNALGGEPTFGDVLTPAIIVATPDMVPSPACSNAIELAWNLIANAYGGDWDSAPAHWREAAERWHDEHWHPASAAARHESVETDE